MGKTTCPEGVVVMPVKFMKLSYDNLVLNEKSFRSLVINGKTVGFNVDLRINYYRGLHVSCIELLQLFIDGKQIPENTMCFVINGKKFQISKLKHLFAEFWGLRTSAHLEVYNKGLDPGKHEVKLILHLRNPYMRFGPGIFGAIDSSCTKNMTLTTQGEQS
jgi:hypothetical protein